MSKVIAIMSMSLDGYVADKQDGVAEVFDGYFSGEVKVEAGGTDAMTFHSQYSIFTKAYPEYASPSDEYNAIDFLRQPNSFERLTKAVQRAKQY